MTPADFERVRLAAALRWTRYGNAYLPVDPQHEAAVEGVMGAYEVGRTGRKLTRGRTC